MGNFLSGSPTDEVITTASNIANSDSETMENTVCFQDSREESGNDEEEIDTATNHDEKERAMLREEEMNEFKKELNIKREQRKEILARHRSEKKALENALQNEIETKIKLCEKNQLFREMLLKNGIDLPENLQCSNENTYITDSITHMKEEIEKLKANNIKLRCDLSSSHSALQTAYADIGDLSAQNTESIKQVNALKEVISCSKTMISLREQQLNELKSKLNEIEHSLADRETNMLSTDLRQEYERQLQNIRTLRSLYEERARLADISRQALARDLDEHKLLLEAEINKSSDLMTKIEEFETKVAALEEAVEDKNNLISTSQQEVRCLKAEMLGINKLFSQALLGNQNKQNLDKLVHQLEENHGILTHMAGREDSSEVSTELPKLLLEIVNQIDEKDETYSNHDINETCSENDISKAEEIVQNLPKVWRVLMELLSHQSEASTDTKKVTTCYKSVETKTGAVLVPSVSQTYIRLKDLILEKLTLIKEVSRMKQLNTHLESRLSEQERRLCLVTNELSKTWHVVGRLRRHHHQLHTHEKILKYELQQKRKLLNELKEELEYCREKWEQAREKNSQSERDWRKLRTEFANRKMKPVTSLSNSAESGYSDERQSDSESNDENENLELKTKYKKKIKKGFETAVDSSTDVNLAEREDPASDMLDIADLPLDAHDSNECFLDSSKSDRLSKLENCEETEDEFGDMIQDLCYDGNVASENDGTQVTLSDNIRDENESLYEHKIKSEIEKDTTDMCENVQETGTFTGHINYASTSTQPNPKEQNNVVISSSPIVVNINKDLNKCDGTQSDMNNDEEVVDFKSSKSKQTVESVTTLRSEESNEMNFSAILENVKKQNERLQLKDKRFENLESGCSSVISNMSETLQSGDKMVAKLDALHSKYTDETKNQNEELKSDVSEEENTLRDLEEPSSSQDIDHEARFAARELRLKRLEEQTKSLVNKVNNTASKGIKIHYKLEELHNIYGSENSRSGTPSEDTSEDVSQNDEDIQNE